MTKPIKLLNDVPQGLPADGTLDEIKQAIDAALPDVPNWDDLAKKIMAGLSARSDWILEPAPVVVPADRVSAIILHTLQGFKATWDTAAAPSETGLTVLKNWYEEPTRIRRGKWGGKVVFSKTYGTASQPVTLNSFYHQVDEYARRIASFYNP